MKKYIPFPIDLSTYPEVREMTCLQFGILMRIIEVFWKTGREIPKNDFTLYHAIRCEYKHWSRCKKQVLKVWWIIFSDIKQARDKAVANKLRQSQVAVIARKAIKTKPKVRRETFSDENEVKKLIITSVPKTHEETAWNKGQFDPIMRKIALKNNEENKGKKIFFTDKPKD